MAKKLTKKRRGFVADFVQTGNATLAVKGNFDVSSDNSARSLASQLLSEPKIAAAIQDAIPDDLLAEKHLALLNKMDNTYDDQIDVNAVSKGLDLAYKIKGNYAAEKHINVNLSADELRETIQNGLTKFRT